jgi:hypothetical protein
MNDDRRQSLHFVTFFTEFSQIYTGLRRGKTIVLQRRLHPARKRSGQPMVIVIMATD